MTVYDVANILLDFLGNIYYMYRQLYIPHGDNNNIKKKKTLLSC